MSDGTFENDFLNRWNEGGVIWPGGILESLCAFNGVERGYRNRAFLKNGFTLLIRDRAKG